MIAAPSVDGPMGDGVAAVGAGTTRATAQKKECTSAFHWDGLSRRLSLCPAEIKADLVSERPGVRLSL